MKINNGNENIEFSNKIAKELTKSDLQAETANSVNETIFKKYDKNNDGKLSADELAAVLNEVDANGDGTVTDQEITDAVNKIDNVKAEKKTEYISFIKNMAAKNAEKVKDDANVGNSYTIQLGEQFDDLIIRIMKAQGESDADAKVGTDKYNKYAEQFKADNPDAFKKNADGSVKWLIASKKVYIRTNTQSDSTDAMKAVKDKNNADEVVQDYIDWRDNGKEKYEYKVDGPAYTRKGSSASGTDGTSGTDSTDSTNSSKGTDNAPKQDPSKVNGSKEEQAKTLGLRETYDKGKNWYYSESEKCHFRWNGKHFERIEGISSVNPGGTFYTTINNKKLNMVPADNVKKGYYFCQTDNCYYEYNTEKKQFVKCQNQGAILLSIKDNLAKGKDKTYAYKGQSYTLTTMPLPDGGTRYWATWNNQVVCEEGSSEKDAEIKIQNWILGRNYVAQHGISIKKETTPIAGAINADGSYSEKTTYIATLGDKTYEGETADEVKTQICNYLKLDKSKVKG